MNDLAQCRTYRRIQRRDCRRTALPDGGANFIGTGTNEWPAASEGFEADDPQGKHVGCCSYRLAFELFGGHVVQRALGSAVRLSARKMSNAKIDDLHRVVLKDKYIAWLDIPVNQPLFMCGVEPAAHLSNNFDGSLDCQVLR